MSVTAKASSPEKGKRYFTQLDQALCDGNWAEVPELARKTDKHAPQRKCFTLTARTEAQIASASHRPTSASSTGISSMHSLGEAIPSLEEAIATEKHAPEDAYCASVCLAEIHWLQENATAALKALPQDDYESRTSDSRVAPQGWLEVCAAKAAFIRAASSEAVAQQQNAEKVYETVLGRTPGSRTPELRRWTERLLGRACMNRYAKLDQESLSSLNDALRAFRSWASFWQRVASSSRGLAPSPSNIDTPRRLVWKSYYELLSHVLQRGILYNPSAGDKVGPLIVPRDDFIENRDVDSKQRQRAELKRVEATYESLLLNETQFPKASQSNLEVEEWVEQATSNWKILCGSDWTDAELGEGGKTAVNRGMLDILYRAATKTFHSTAILRQLFNVHAALGEFDLCMHAFDSYVEIVGKGKARAAKTGKHELGFDNDDIAILTAADAIRKLCRYGDREQGERATQVAHTIEKWLDEQRPTSDREAQSNSDDNRVHEAHPPSDPTKLHLLPKTLAAAYRAVGISEAHWARMTYEADTRSALQAEALKHLQMAVTYDESSVETAYALARLLAEVREVPTAIDIIKQCIATPSSLTAANGEANDDEHLGYLRQRELVPLWHLLALCLTARDEYEPAMRMCEAAFEQFGDSDVLFGPQPTPVEDVEKQGEANRNIHGLIDQMDTFEKEVFVEVKMSQLTLVELMEGSNAAVDLSDELLGLYARLFGNPELARLPDKPPPTPVIAAPSKTGGTLRSLAGSIRSKSVRDNIDKDTFQLPSNAPTARVANAETNSRTQNTNGQAGGAPISITVTNEDGEKAQSGHHHHRHLPFKVRGHHDNFREIGFIRGKKTAADKTENSVMDGVDKPLPAPAPKDTEAIDHAAILPANPPVVDAAVQQSSSKDNPTRPDQPLKEIEHNAPHGTWPPPPGHDNQPPTQDLRLPAPHPASDAPPEPRLDSLQERQHKLSLLVNVWLFIARLYLRADLFDDAAGAVDEAYRLVETFEAEKGAEHSSARNFYFKGWGGGKSVDELWAEICSVRGALASARKLPFEAMAHYEEALLSYPDHPEGIIGVSDLLMDIYEEKMPAEQAQPILDPLSSATGPLIDTLSLSTSRPTTAKSSLANTEPAVETKRRHIDPTPAELNRLAARDRAYMLLSNLTRLGSGWDNPEAWFTLARSYELSRQIGKAQQALWWVVELEDNKPMRPWSQVTAGGYTL